ncbi:MAG: hypothetical protein FWC68_01615 [Oscillospiraceae bacterium]|nr:hypothetical protein [Oscillospiraceae bacterium]
MFGIVGDVELEMGEDFSPPNVAQVMSTVEHNGEKLFDLRSVSYEEGREALAEGEVIRIS